jgi:hypothetical protein
MTTSNIEKFDVTVGKAFALLYESFPLPRPLLAGAFVGEDNVIDKTSFTEAELTNDAEFFMASIQWLIDAEYISSKERWLIGFREVVLTAKGLEVLKAVPDSLQGPIGERLAAAAKTEGREVIRSLVGQALGMGLQVLF